MKWDIENKILIPFLVLIILPILILGIMTYISGYQLNIQSNIKNVETRLEEDTRYIGNILKGVDSDEIDKNEAKEMIVSYLLILNKKDMMLVDEDSVVINNFSNNNRLVREILTSMEDNTRYTNEDTKEIYIKRSITELGMIIGYGVNTGYFIEDLLSIQKYTLLITIVFMIISMQATILIAHNISKPMKKLAEYCNNIGENNLSQQIDMNRQDEVGVLADALNNMVSKLSSITTKLRSAQKYNEDILRNINVGIITTDRLGEIIKINQRGSKLLEGHWSDENDREYLHSRLTKEIGCALACRENRESVVVLNNSNGINRKYISMNISLMESGIGTLDGAICSFVDITKRKRIEHNMERINRLTSIGEMAARLAHEIRNPLAGMKMSIAVLRNRLCSDSMESSNRKLFDSTIYEIDRLNDIVTQLLDFSKPHKPRYEPSDIEEIIDISIELASKETGNKVISISKDIPSLPLVLVDKAQLEQVIINLVRNSINAIEDKGNITLRVKIVEGIRDFMEIAVIDNGCGIKKEHLDRVFNPFYTTSPNGTGLGLSVVYKLVTENKGSIDIKSEEDVGTRVVIRFPLNREAIETNESTDNR